MDEKEKIEKKIKATNENNKLLYDPNQRFERRLGAFSMSEDDEDDEELESEESEEIENENLEEETNHGETPSMPSSLGLGLPTKKQKNKNENVNEKEKNNKFKQKAKKKIESAKTSKAGAKAIKTFKNIWAFIVANPGILLIIIAIIFIFIVVFLLVLGYLDGTGSRGTKVGLNGYTYYELDNMCEEIYVYGTDGADGTYPLEDYVAGVVAAEVGGFDDDTVYETFAIAARTYALSRLQNSEECSIEGTARAQAFRVNTNEKITAAAINTRGLVLTRNGNMISTEYDAFCWSSKDTNYYTLQNDLKVPIDWAESHVWSQDYLNCQCDLNDPEQDSCWSTTSSGSRVWSDGGHGRGMSQYGTLYLSQEEGMNRDEILSFFYGDVEIMSIYQSVGYSGEFPIDPSSELYQGLTFLTGTSFESLLSSQGSSIEEYNAYLKGIVDEVGVGTREATVASAVSLIGSLANMGYRLTYQWGGKYYSVGANPNWGNVADMSWLCDNYASRGYTRSTCENEYKWHSFDCSGFVNWAIVNGFQEYDSTRVQPTGEGNVTLNANEPVCLPGDVLVNPGHIMLIVGTDDVNKQYIIAESTGSRLDTGRGGVWLSTISYNGNKGDNKYTCRSLEDIYVSNSTLSEN